MKNADYVYQNIGDTRRARVFRRENGRWDFDLFRRFPAGGWSMTTWSSDGAEYLLPTKTETVRTVEDQIGQLKQIRPASTVTEGWPERPPPKVTKDAHIKIEAGQIWRHGTRRLRVDWVQPHWNQERAPGVLEIGCHFIEPSGRETGSMIVGRNSARQRYGEQRFREKYRFVK